MGEELKAPSSPDSEYDDIDVPHSPSEGAQAEEEEQVDKGALLEDRWEKKAPDLYSERRNLFSIGGVYGEIQS